VTGAGFTGSASQRRSTGSGRRSTIRESLPEQAAQLIGLPADPFDLGPRLSTEAVRRAPSDRCGGSRRDGAVAALTGFVGAGGGFVIVPALVVLVGMPIKEATASVTVPRPASRWR
jgi:uncharacterized membrane protein YfcA